MIVLLRVAGNAQDGDIIRAGVVLQSILVVGVQVFPMVSEIDAAGTAAVAALGLDAVAQRRKLSRIGVERCTVCIVLGRLGDQRLAVSRKKIGNSEPVNAVETGVLVHPKLEPIPPQPVQAILAHGEAFGDALDSAIAAITRNDIEGKLAVLPGCHHIALKPVVGAHVFQCLAV